jgi:glycosyltransferase involved in cell wall biosynthesis
MISIIIPALNEEKYLPRLLDSIKQQDFNNYEIIVSDFNSRDRTRELAKKYGAKVVKGGRPGAARNTGVKFAKGDILLFLDADTVLPSGFLREILLDFKSRKLNIAVPGMIADSRKPFDKLLFFIGDIFLRLAQWVKPFGAGQIMVEKKIHNKVGGFNETMNPGEDSDFVVRASSYGKFRVLKSKLQISARRFEVEGYGRVAWKTILSIYYFVTGKENNIEYKFDIYNNR